MQDNKKTRVKPSLSNILLKCDPAFFLIVYLIKK